MGSRCHRTADGELVAIHDATVDRTTGTGAVAEVTLEALRRLDAARGRAMRFEGERIPTLAECAAWRGRAALVEIKAAGIAPIRCLHARGGGSAGRELHHLLLPGDRPAREEIRPGATVGLSPARRRDLPQVAELGLDAFCPHYAAATEEMARELHAANRLLSVWTVNDEDGMRRMAALGSDLITSDNPALALEVLPRG